MSDRHALKRCTDEVFVSTDVETDGPVPGLYSMLSLGSAALKADARLLGTFSVNLTRLPGAEADPQALQWWAKHPGAWQATQEHAEPPEQAMRRYVEWVEGLPGKAVFVGYPAAFDFMFVYWYLMRFVGRSPFAHSALDIKTYAMAMMREPYYWSTKHNMPQRWFSEVPHTHRAIDDALEQGLLFCNMLAENCEGQEGIDPQISQIGTDGERKRQHTKREGVRRTM